VQNIVHHITVTVGKSYVCFLCFCCCLCVRWLERHGRSSALVSNHPLPITSCSLSIHVYIFLSTSHLLCQIVVCGSWCVCSHCHSVVSFSCSGSCSLDYCSSLDFHHHHHCTLHLSSDHRSPCATNLSVWTLDYLSVKV